MGRLSHTLMSSGGSPILTCGHPDKQDCGVCFVLLLTSAQRIVLLLSLTPVSNTRWCSSVLCLLQRGKECCRTAQVFSTQSVWDAVQRGCMGGGQRCCLHVRYSPPLPLIAHNIAVLTCSQYILPIAVHLAGTMRRRLAYFMST